jgi:hypothetical protein
MAINLNNHSINKHSVGRFFSRRKSMVLCFFEFTYNVQHTIARRYLEFVGSRITVHGSRLLNLRWTVDDGRSGTLDVYFIRRKSMVLCFFEFTYNAQHTIAQRVFLIRWTMDVVFSWLSFYSFFELPVIETEFSI